MANFMGQRLGTVLNNPFTAIRARLPSGFPTSLTVDTDSHHLRFLLSTPFGLTLSPFVRTVTQKDLVDRTSGKTVRVARLTTDALTSDHTFHIYSCTIVDFANQEVIRPLNFKLPYEVVRDIPLAFTWCALCR
jgi:hypothetical protein